MPQFTNLNLVGMSYVKHPIHLAYLEIKLTMLKLELFVNNNMRLGIIYSWYASIWKVFAIDFYYWQSIFMTIDHVYFSLHWIHIHTLFCLSLENVLTDFDKKKHMYIVYVYIIFIAWFVAKKFQSSCWMSFAVRFFPLLNSRMCAWWKKSCTNIC